MHVRVLRIGSRHHSAGIVATGRDGVEQGFVKAFNGRADGFLDDPVELEGLARSQPDRVAGMGLGKLIDLQPLRGRADAAGKAHAHHEG